MSQLVNHSDLQNVSIISPNQQLFLRLDNGLSGQAGFGRTNIQTFERGLSVFTAVAISSASWSNAASSVITFQPAILAVNSNSANWNSAFDRTTFLGTYSAGWSAGSTAVNSNSANWNVTFTTVNANSAKWVSSFTTLNSNSALWVQYGQIIEGSGPVWQATTDFVDNRKSDWDSTFTTMSSNSANWNSVNAVVNANSAIWNTVDDPIISGKILSANDIRANITVNSLPSFILDPTQSGKTIICDAANGTIISIPENVNVDIPIETQITFISFHSTGTTIFSAGPSVTVNSFNDSLSAGGKNAAVTCLKSGINTWFLIGNLA